MEANLEDSFPFEQVSNSGVAMERGRPAPSHPSGDKQVALSSNDLALTEIEKSRAIQEVQASLVIAKRFPRDEIGAQTRMLTSCQRFSLAEKAFFNFPRGGKKVTGPTIRLAEMMAQAWGNLDYGFKEIEKAKGFSVVEAHCWDLETNTKASRTFTVEHKIQLKDGKVKHLVDPRDQYERMANDAQRRVRSCILQILPGDIVEAVTNKCKETIKKGPVGVPFVDQVKKMVLGFQVLHVNKEMLEKYLGHPVENVDSDELVELKGIFNAIDGGAPREDFFDLGGGKTDGGKAQELNVALASKKKEEK